MWPAMIMVHVICLDVCLTQISPKLSEIDIWLLAVVYWVYKSVLFDRAYHWLLLALLDVSYSGALQILRWLIDWLIAKHGGGYTQKGVAYVYTVYPAYLWSLRWVYAVKKTRRLVYGVYPPIHHWLLGNLNWNSGFPIQNLPSDSRSKVRFQPFWVLLGFHFAHSDRNGPVGLANVVNGSVETVTSQHHTGPVVDQLSSRPIPYGRYLVKHSNMQVAVIVREGNCGKICEEFHCWLVCHLL